MMTGPFNEANERFISEINGLLDYLAEVRDCVVGKVREGIGLVNIRH